MRCNALWASTYLASALPGAKVVRFLHGIENLHVLLVQGLRSCSRESGEQKNHHQGKIPFHSTDITQTVAGLAMHAINLKGTNC
jgi:hypothetical protein